MMTTLTMMMSRYQQMERNKRRREAKEKEHSSLSSIRWLLIRLDKKEREGFYLHLKG